MSKIRSLVSFVGMRDPYPANDEEPGPILSQLVYAARQERPYDEAWLLCTGGNFLERARDLEREVQDEGLALRVYPVDFPVRDVIDYAEIWSLLCLSLSGVRESAGAVPREWSLLLDSGTPQMSNCLLLAGRAGLFPGRLVQGIPARFAGGSYKSREVRLDGLPTIELCPQDREEGRRGRSRVPSGAEEPIAESAAFTEAMRRAVAVARYDDPVLILGETGTGKTMVARRIHGASARRGGPFVEVNCSAIPENLAESELFGHVRGAYTGADKARSGKFRAAHGGTLFLDEIGDLPLELQAKLLKALEDGEVTPIGSDDPVKAEARLVAATNRDLQALVREGGFRRDLYERLKVVVVRLCPLRERREDIQPLVDYFLRQWNEQYEERRAFTPEALALLTAYAWPGNVRELKNAIRSAACSAAGESLGPESLPEEITRGASSLSGAEALAATPALKDGRRGAELADEGVNLKARLLQVEWDYVNQALRKAEGNREAAARLLGMTGHAFRKALRERLSAFADEGWEEGE